MDERRTWLRELRGLGPALSLDGMLPATRPPQDTKRGNVIIPGSCPCYGHLSLSAGHFSTELSAPLHLSQVVYVRSPVPVN